MLKPLDFSSRVIAHRGASAYVPENTMAAFAKAKQLGATWIETDVMLSQDQVVMVFHDETLERTTNGLGRLADSSSAALQGLDAGSWFDSRYQNEPIPTLAELMRFIAGEKMAINIEMKAPVGAELALVKQLVKIVQPYLNNISILFSSFSYPALIALREELADAHLGLLLHKWDSSWLDLYKRLGCSALDVCAESMNLERIHKIKKHQVPLLAYTANERAKAKKLFEWGVDAVFTDCPDIILNLEY